jgi:hypothetical protein
MKHSCQEEDPEKIFENERTATQGIATFLLFWTVVTAVYILMALRSL